MSELSIQKSRSRHIHYYQTLDMCFPLHDQFIDKGHFIHKSTFFSHNVHDNAAMLVGSISSVYIFPTMYKTAGL